MSTKGIREVEKMLRLREENEKLRAIARKSTAELVSVSYELTSVSYELTRVIEERDKMRRGLLCCYADEPSRIIGRVLEACGIGYDEAYAAYNADDNDEFDPGDDSTCDRALGWMGPVTSPLAPPPPARLRCDAWPKRGRQEQRKSLVTRKVGVVTVRLARFSTRSASTYRTVRDRAAGPSTSGRVGAGRRSERPRRSR